MRTMEVRRLGEASAKEWRAPQRRWTDRPGKGGGLARSRRAAEERLRASARLALTARGSRGRRPAGATARGQIDALGYRALRIEEALGQVVGLSTNDRATVRMHLESLFDSPDSPLAALLGTIIASSG
jgi:hypothetical protein